MCGSCGWERATCVKVHSHCVGELTRVLPVVEGVIIIMMAGHGRRRNGDDDAA